MRLSYHRLFSFGGRKGKKKKKTQGDFFLRVEGGEKKGTKEVNIKECLCVCGCRGGGGGGGVDCSRDNSRENTQQNLIHKQLFEQCG